MHKIKQLAEKELREIEESGNLNSQNLKAVMDLTCIVKNIDTINAMEEAKYSNRGSYDGSYARSNDSSYNSSYNSYRGSYDGMSSERDRRGRNEDGSYRMRQDGGRDQRYSYGYSRDLKEDLEHLKQKSQGREKELLERFIKEL